MWYTVNVNSTVTTHFRPKIYLSDFGIFWFDSFFDFFIFIINSLYGLKSARIRNYEIRKGLEREKFSIDTMSALFWVIHPLRFVFLWINDNLKIYTGENIVSLIRKLLTVLDSVLKIQKYIIAFKKLKNWKSRIFSEIKHSITVKYTSIFIEWFIKVQIAARYIRCCNYSASHVCRFIFR